MSFLRIDLNRKQFPTPGKVSLQTLSQEVRAVLVRLSLIQNPFQTLIFLRHRDKSTRLQDIRPVGTCATVVDFQLGYIAFGVTLL